MEADIRVMQPQTKEHLEPAEDGRGKDSPLECSDGVPHCWRLDFGLLACRTARGYISVVFSHQVCGRLSGQSQEMNILPLGVWVNLRLHPVNSWQLFQRARPDCHHPGRTAHMSDWQSLGHRLHSSCKGSWQSI